MWKLKMGEVGDEEWLTTTNNHVGRQHWEFDLDAGTEEERAHIDKIRTDFKMNQFKFKESADLLMRMQDQHTQKEDLYYPHPLVQDMVWGVLHNVAEPILTRWPFSRLREKALKVEMEHVHYEDQSIRYLCIGCVERVLCLIATWVEDPNRDAYKHHLARIPDYFWVAEDGMKMQAIMSSNLAEEYGPNLRKAHDFVKSSQVRDNPPRDFSKMYRHTSKGAWTFSIQGHGWQVSDCTAEGLKVALLYSQMSQELVGEKLETERLYDAVNVILSLQSENGGFPAWEPQRAYSWLEKFNPTEFFEDVLIEREYVECTSSAIQGMVVGEYVTPMEYTNLDGNRSNLVHTSWALISLIKAGQAEIDRGPIERGIRLLINSQMEGDFPQQEIT
ncbi:hypothetical protein L1987_29678 [Smallanthus sonchifolius]|uniref:Uncharacterized protein n=1 Tax=Smallanthus sonchifolius TaxID=185202 RepID=A0ACB9I0N4_9ASTR|nr:hypothetical protein L1987_29678 [Smallanthus sonchifolius]